MRTNNRGFSYVEFILVIAIMAIMVGIAALSMGLVNRANVNRGIEKVGSSLNQARNSAMAKGYVRGTFEITRVGDTYYYFVGDANSTEKDNLKDTLISSPATVGYYVVIDGTETLIPITATNPLVIQYNQSTGAFRPMADGNYCTGIVLTNGDKEAVIRLYPETGKSELVY